MKKLFTVYDSFYLTNQEIVIGGVNSNLDQLTHEEIRLIIGENVILRRIGKPDLKLHVKEIQISNSLINKKNIFIRVADKIKPSEIPSGSEIYDID